MNLNVGDRIGSYKLCRKLGEGGMGVVFEAVHKEIERRVAIKVLRPEIAQNQQILHRLFNEARAVNLIEHPGSVQIHDCVSSAEGGMAYLVMEYLHGVTLGARLAESGGRLAECDVLRIAREISDLLSAAHRKRIVHRDLKPENIMLVPDPAAASGERVKVLDFGIAKLGETGTSRTGTNLIMGTPRYMSPEQCMGAGHVDGQTDVYSLGVLLFQMLAGALPFNAYATPELLYQHMTMPPPDLRTVAPHVTAETAGMVMRMLEKDRANRPTMAEVAARLLAEPRGPGDMSHGQRPAASPHIADLPTGVLLSRGGQTEQFRTMTSDVGAGEKARHSAALPSAPSSQEPAARQVLRQRWLQFLLGAGASLALGLPLHVALVSQARPSSEVVSSGAGRTGKPGRAGGAPNAAQGAPIELLHHTAATVQVSSTVRHSSLSPRSLVDGNFETAWNSRPGDLVGATVSFTVPEYSRVGHILLTAGFTKVNEKGDLFTMNHRITRVAIFREGALLGQFALDPHTRGMQEIPIHQPGGHFELQVIDVLAGTHPSWRELCISELQVWGWLPSQYPPRKQEPVVGVAGSP